MSNEGGFEIMNWESENEYVKEEDLSKTQGVDKKRNCSTRDNNRDN